MLPGTAVGDGFRPGASARRCCVCCAARILSPCRGSWGSRRRGPRSGGISFWPQARQPRSVTASPVPVDVIRTEEFASQGTPDLANQLRTVVPSFNVSIQPISDAATIVRPAHLRNLAPDHTLILVNGKRRHRAAVITWLGNGIADGSQGPDLSVIPSIAIRQAEVLRDGAVWTPQWGLVSSHRPIPHRRPGHPYRSTRASFRQLVCGARHPASARRYAGLTIFSPTPLAEWSCPSSGRRPSLSVSCSPRAVAVR